MYALLWMPRQCSTAIARLDACARAAERDGDDQAARLLRLASDGSLCGQSTTGLVSGSMRRSSGA